MVPTYWPEATEALSEKDAVLAGIISRYQGEYLTSRGDPFLTLVRSVVGQQISVKAADTIWQRLISRYPVQDPLVLSLAPNDTLRACGLSARKVEYIKALAEHFLEEDHSPDRWCHLVDAQIVGELTSIRGIGRWTAEMFLIFTLLRPDVLPVDDIGLQRAVALHYLSGERPTKRQMLMLGENWQPWRSVATWYLWRSLDPVPVVY